MKFKEFLSVCEENNDEKQIIDLVNKHLKLISNSKKYNEEQKVALYNKISNSCCSNKNKDIKNKIIEIFKTQEKYTEKKHGTLKKDNTSKEKVQRKESFNTSDKLKFIESLPSDKFLKLYEEGEKLFPLDIYTIENRTDETSQSSGPGKMKLRIKASGVEKEFDRKTATILLQKGAAERITVKKIKVEETYETKRDRLHEIANEMFQRALAGDSHVFELLAVLLGSGNKITFDKSTTLSTIISEVLADFKGPELPMFLVKLLTGEFKPKAYNPHNYGQKKKAEFLAKNLKYRTLDLIRLRIPAVFRRDYVKSFEEKIKLSELIFRSKKELAFLKKPSTSGYSTDQKTLTEVEQKIDTAQQKISDLENNFKQIDLAVQNEISLIEEIDNLYSVPNIREIINIYQSEYFGERDKYIESKKPKKSKTKGYYSSIDDVIKNFQEILSVPNILQTMNVDQVLEACRKMFFDFMIFLKEPDLISDKINFIYGEIKDENAAKALINTLGKVLEYDTELSLYPGFDLNKFESVRRKIGILLYSVIKEGKGLQRVHAYASLGRLGLLHTYEKEEFLYEEYFKEFKFESQQLLNDPFLEDFKTSLYIGAKKLMQINTRLFLSKKESLRKTINDQILMMQTKGDNLSEELFKELSLII